MATLEPGPQHGQPCWLLVCRGQGQGTAREATGTGYPGDFLGDEPLSFSSDGFTWHTWIAQELVDATSPLSIVGMGDEFIVLFDHGTHRLWVGTVER